MGADGAALLAARMRAAADLVEACGAAGLHASCYSTGEISVGVTSHAGDGPARAKILAGLALLLQARPGRSDSRASPAAWLTATGTPLASRCTPTPGWPSLPLPVPAARPPRWPGPPAGT
jgi:hypothetical protein